MLPLLALLGCNRPHPVPEAPEPGGTLRIGVFAPLEPMSPVLATRATTLNLLAHTMPPLGSLGERGDVRLHLARTHADTGTLVVFRLRPLRWEDGVPVTAGDLVWTVSLLRDHRTRSPERPRIDLLRDAVALDDSTLRLEYATFYARRTRDMLLAAMPRHAMTAAADPREIAAWPVTRQPLSYGPFRVRESSSYRLRLERNPASGYEPQPYLDAVEVRTLDVDSAVDSFRAGVLDVLESVPPDKLAEVRRVRGARTLALVGRSYLFVGWNLRDARFADAAVRRAAAHAVDVQALIRELTFGQADASRGPLVPALDFDDTTAVLVHDPSRARQLLDAAGWRDADGDGVRERRGAVLSFHVLVPSGDPLRAAVAQRVARDLARVGMHATVHEMLLVEMVSRLGSRTFEAFVGEWFPDLGLDLDAVWRSDSQEAQNYGGYADAGVDSLLTRMHHELEPAERAQVLHAFQTRVYGDQPYLFLFQNPRFLVLSERVRGAEPTVLSSFDNLAAWWIPRAHQRR